MSYIYNYFSTNLILPISIVSRTRFNQTNKVNSFWPAIYDSIFVFILNNS